MKDHILDRPPAGAADDWTVAQCWESHRPDEHALWDRLFARQSRLLPGRAAPEFLSGIRLLRMDRPGIPRFDELSERLSRLTGWEVVAVPGLIPDAVFFDHLANRRFVSGNFIRSAQQMDYLQEPDVFHDIFGHVPLLAHPPFADFMQAYGEGGRRAGTLGAIHRLARLYWYTVEFGLVRDGAGLRIFGAGIVSSHGESIYALDDPAALRIAFRLKRVMRTPYRIDTFQPNYFVVDSFDNLLRQAIETDFAPIYAELAGQPDIPIGSVLPGERSFPARRGGRPQASDDHDA